MIYVVTERDNPSVIKIGYTRTPGEAVNIEAVRKRLGGLQVSTWRALVCIGACDGSVQDEQALHDRFRSYRVSGEWFTNKGDVAEWVESVLLAKVIVGGGVVQSSHEERMQLHTFLRNARQRGRHRAAKARTALPAESRDPYTSASSWMWRGKIRHG